MSNVNDHAYAVLNTIARPASAPAAEHTLAALLTYWRTDNALTTWQQEITFVNAASGITNNFEDSWHKYWDDQD